MWEANEGPLDVFAHPNPPVGACALTHTYTNMDTQTLSQILTMIANEVLGRSDFQKWLSLWERRYDLVMNAAKAEAAQWEKESEEEEDGNEDEEDEEEEDADDESEADF